MSVLPSIVNMDCRLPTRVGIVGGGLMGCEIAVANLRQGIAVTLCEISEAVRRSAMERIDRRLAGDPESIRHRDKLVLTGRLADLAASAVVVESVTEKLKTKHRVLKQLEAVVPVECILASNTSSIPIAQLSSVLQQPERLAGLHFCHPIERRALVEVVAGSRTSPETVSALQRYAHLLGKLPLLVGDGPGFLLNRIMFPYLAEALLLVDAGVAIERIDAAARSFGMPVGPCEQIDRMGIDVVARAGGVFATAFPDRATMPRCLLALFESQQWGVKSRQGFYRYDSDGRRMAGAAAQNRAALPLHETLSDQELIWRLFLPMLLEATRVLDEGLIRSVTDVDLALVNGLGLSAERGGLVGWAHSCGWPRVVGECRRLARDWNRYSPTEWLLRTAASADRERNVHEHRDAHGKAA